MLSQSFEILLAQSQMQTSEKLHQLGGERGIDSLPIDKHPGCSDILQSIDKIRNESKL